MDQTFVIAAGLLLLSVVSGMLGLGVAFAAVPFLAFFMADLVHEIQPLSLFLNGVTALFSAFGFAWSGLVAWRPALLLAVVTTIAAPFGAWLAQFIPQSWIWGVYFIAVAYLAARMFLPEKPEAPHTEGSDEAPHLTLILLLAVPISLLAGLLGVGPGFLLMPALILVGFAPKRAAAINAVAVTPPSFSALIPHISTMTVDLYLAGILIAVGAVGSFAGARLTSLFVSGAWLKRIFGLLIVVMTAYKLFQIISK